VAVACAQVGLDIAFHGAGVTADDALDVARMEEGGVEGPKLVALRGAPGRVAPHARARGAPQLPPRPPPLPTPPPATPPLALTPPITLTPLSPLLFPNPPEGRPSPKARGPALPQPWGRGPGQARAPPVHPRQARRPPGQGQGQGQGQGRGRRARAVEAGARTLGAGTGAGPGGLWGRVAAALEGPLRAVAGCVGGRNGGGAAGAGGHARDVWLKELEATSLGQFSLAMYEANYVMEDALEVHPRSPFVQALAPFAVRLQSFVPRYT